MANRRMFSVEITDSDAFVEMPLSAQALYLHLGMHADDDGFVNGASRIQRSIGASLDDMKLLAAKKFIIPFESGLIVIKHWKMNNYIRNDRYHPTKYVSERAMLNENGDGIYHLKNNAPELGGYQMDTDGIPMVYQMDTEVRLGKVTSKEDKSSLPSGKPETTPEISEVIDYLNAKTGRKYRAKGKNAQLVSARLAEGYSVADCKRVVDVKVAEWGSDPKMSAFLRPETLFCKSHFDGYLNQPMPGEVSANAPSEWDDVGTAVSFD